MKEVTGVTEDHAFGPRAVVGPLKGMGGTSPRSHVQYSNAAQNSAFRSSLLPLAAGLAGSIDFFEATLTHKIFPSASSAMFSDACWRTSFVKEGSWNGSPRSTAVCLMFRVTLFRGRFWRLSPRCNNTVL